MQRGSRRELAVVALALLLPIPLLAVSGLTLPLPALVERGLASLAPGAGDEPARGKAARSSAGAVQSSAGSRDGAGVAPRTTSHEPRPGNVETDAVGESSSAPTVEERADDEPDSADDELPEEDAPPPPGGDPDVPRPPGGSADGGGAETEPIVVEAGIGEGLSATVSADGDGAEVDANGGDAGSVTVSIEPPLPAASLPLPDPTALP